MHFASKLHEYARKVDKPLVLNVLILNILLVSESCNIISLPS